MRTNGRSVQQEFSARGLLDPNRARPVDTI
jgi:hypothetical protein